MKRHVNVVDWTDKDAVRAYRAMKSKEYYRNNRDSILLKLRNRTDEQRRKNNEYRKSWRLRNIDRVLSQERKRRASLSQEKRAKLLAYYMEYARRPDVAARRKAYRKEYYSKNKDRIKVLNKARWSRYKSDKEFLKRRYKYEVEYRKRLYVKSRRHEEGVRYREKHAEQLSEYRKLYLLRQDVIEARRRYFLRPDVIEGRRRREKLYRLKNLKAIRALESMRISDIVDKCESDHVFYAEYRRKQREKYRRKRERMGKTYKPNHSKRIPDWCVKGDDYFDKRSVFMPNNRSDDQLVADRSFNIELHKDRFGTED